MKGKTKRQPPQVRFWTSPSGKGGSRTKNFEDSVSTKHGGLRRPQPPPNEEDEKHRLSKTPFLRQFLKVGVSGLEEIALLAGKHPPEKGKKSSGKKKD